MTRTNSMHQWIRAAMGVVAAAMFATACSGGSDDAAEDLPPVSIPAADTSPDAAFLTGTSDVIYDQDELHTFELHLANEDLAFLDKQPTAEEYVEGTLTFNGETIGPVGIRYKGSIGAFVDCLSGSEPFNPDGEKDCTKLSIKVDINLYEPEQEFYGLRKLQFHSMNIDPSMMRERLGYWAFREAGLPAPRSTHARIMINGQYNGIYALVEQIDGRFLNEWFDDNDGNLYKEVWPIDPFGNVQNDDRIAEGLRTNEDLPADFSLFKAFGADLLAADGDDIAGVLDAASNLDDLLTFVALDRIIQNDDGPLHLYCESDGCENHNYYWYEDPSTQKLHLIVWDLDNAFENLTEPSNEVTPIADEFGDISNDCEIFEFEDSWIPQRSAACDPLLGALASFDAELDAKRAELLADPFSWDQVDALLAAWEAQITPAVAEAAELHDDAPSVEEWQAGLERLRTDIETIYG